MDADDTPFEVARQAAEWARAHPDPRPLAVVPPHDCPAQRYGAFCDVCYYAAHPGMIANRKCTCVVTDEGRQVCAHCRVQSVINANRPAEGGSWSANLASPTTSAPFGSRHEIDEAVIGERLLHVLRRQPGC